MQHHINTYYNDNKCGLKHVYYQNGNLVLGGKSFVTSFLRGSGFVTKCDEGGEGVKNRPKSRDVIYGRPPRLHYNYFLVI